MITFRNASTFLIHPEGVFRGVGLKRRSVDLSHVILISSFVMAFAASFGCAIAADDEQASSDDGLAAVDRTQESEELVAQATALLTLGKFAMAEKRLQTATKIDQNSVKAPAMLGLLHAVVLDDPLEASKYFKEVLARDPENGEALNNLAVCNYLSRRSSGIASLFEQALQNGAPIDCLHQNVEFIINDGKLNRKHMEELVSVYRDALQTAVPSAGGATAANVIEVRSMSLLCGDGIQLPERYRGHPATFHSFP